MNASEQTEIDIVRNQQAAGMLTKAEADKAIEAIRKRYASK